MIIIICCFNSESECKIVETDSNEYNHDLKKRRATIRFRRKSPKKTAERYQSDELKKANNSDKLTSFLRNKKHLRLKNLNLKRRSVSLYDSPFKHESMNYELSTMSHDSCNIGK